MNLHNTPEDRLCREIWAKRSEWDNQNLTNEVYLAVRDNHPRRLVRLIDELVAGVKMQRTTIIEQEQEIQKLREENDRLRRCCIKPPAQRDDLDIEKMIQLYQRHKSFRKVGQLMGCDGKTVKKYIGDDFNAGSGLVNK